MQPRHLDAKAASARSVRTAVLVFRPIVCECLQSRPTLDSQFNVCFIINGSSRTDFRRLSNWHLVLSSSAVATATRRSSCAFSPFSTCITHCTLRWESFANFNSFSVCSSFVLSCWHCAALESYALLSLWLWLCHFSCSACWKAADSAHRLLFSFKLLTSASSSSILR